jgi:hypothetical protein
MGAPGKSKAKGKSKITSNGNGNGNGTSNSLRLLLPVDSTQWSRSTAMRANARSAPAGSP